MGESPATTVDAADVVTAVGNGLATVTASLASSSGSATITVKQRAATVEITPGTFMFTYVGGNGLRLNAQVFDANGHEMRALIGYRWNSSNPEVATIDDWGLPGQQAVMSSIGSGTTTVTFCSGQGWGNTETEVTGTALVTVELAGRRVEASLHSLSSTRTATRIPKPASMGFPDSVRTEPKTEPQAAYCWSGR